MPEERKHPPVLGDTKRPPKVGAIERWLGEADKIRKWREEGLAWEQTEDGAVLLEDEADLSDGEGSA